MSSPYCCNYGKKTLNIFFNIWLNGCHLYNRNLFGFFQCAFLKEGRSMANVELVPQNTRFVSNINLTSLCAKLKKSERKSHLSANYGWNCLLLKATNVTMEIRHQYSWVVKYMDERHKQSYHKLNTVKSPLLCFCCQT